MLIGYMRPNEEDLECEYQRHILKEVNCNKLFAEDQCTLRDSVLLKEIIGTLNEGDKIVVVKLFILADTTRHLVDILEIIQSKGGHLLSLSEDIDTSNSKGYDFINIVRHLVEFERDAISEKTKKGLHEAKEKGICTGRPRKPDKNVQRAIEMYESKKYTLEEIKAETGISKSTLYRYLNQ